MNSPPLASELSVAAILKKGASGKLLGLFAPLIDEALGIASFRRKYERNGMAGLERYAFIERFIEREGIEYGFDSSELARVPKTGPVLVVSNHPLGGLEGFLLAYLLRLARPDYKVFANVMDYYLVELREFFIFTNPMAKGSLANVESIRQSRQWLAEGHCLLVFPAGRVGLYRPEKGYVTDEVWDEVALRLGVMTHASIVPVFVEGECSSLFSALSRYIYPMKLLFLIWEFLRSLRKRVVFHVGLPIPASSMSSMGRRRANAWLRMRTYLLCPPGKGPERSRGGPDRKAAGILHPEVEDYIDRHGLCPAEIEELAVGAEDPAFLRATLSELAGARKDSKNKKES